MSRLIDEARAGGANVVTGGVPAEELGPLFDWPIAVVDIADDASLVVEEHRGPVTPVLRYFDIDAAVERGVWRSAPESRPVVVRVGAERVSGSRCPRSL